MKILNFLDQIMLKRVVNDLSAIILEFYSRVTELRSELSSCSGSVGIYATSKVLVNRVERSSLDPRDGARG